MSSGAWIEMIYNQNAFMPFVALAKSNAKFSLYFSVCSEGVFRDKHTEPAPRCALCCGACGWAGSLSTQCSLMVTPLRSAYLSYSWWQNPPTKSAGVDVVRGGVGLSQNSELFSSKENLPCQPEADHRDTHLLLGATCVLVFWTQTSFFSLKN